MDRCEFSQQVETIRHKAGILQQQATETTCQDVLFLSSLQELQTALEELQVADEELRQQSELLASSNYVIAAQQQRYQDLFEFAPDAYLVTDRVGVIREANQAATRLLNVSKQFLIGKPLATFVPLAERPLFRLRLQQLPELRRIEDWEVQIERRDQSTLTVAVTVAIAASDLHQESGMRWLLRDISGRKQADRQIQKLNAELRQRIALETTMKQVSDRIRDSLDETQVLQTAVHELTQLLGTSDADVALYDLESGTSTIRCSDATVGRPSTTSSTIPMETFPEVYQQLLQGNYLQFSELSEVSNRERLSVLAYPIADAQGVLGDFWLFRPLGSAFSSIEIVAVQQVAHQCAIAIRQAQLHQAAQAQVAELHRLHQLKDEFLSTVSHELRTPITNMRMAIRMLKFAKTPEQHQRYLQILKSECDREAELVCDLLDMQGLKAQTYPQFFASTINLVEWLPTVVEPIELKAQQRRQNLEVHISLTSPSVTTEPQSLRRIVSELLTNACKYTPDGGEIQLRVTDDPWAIANTVSNLPTAVIVQVVNQAEIPTSELPRIFEEFYRIPKSDRWQQGGTGLGLSLVQQLVEHLQGTLQVESNQGWTTFTVCLPHQPEHQSALQT